MNTKKKIIVRYPPSPTGKLHIGNIRTFLFNYLLAKKNDGEIILRFEDTDKERSKKVYEDFTLETLQKLGLTFDRGPFRQSDRLEFYEEALETLIKNGNAFVAEDSKEGSGEKVIRFKNPHKKITFLDSVRGEITIDTTDFGDFVIARSKKNPLYHLTVVVDDLNMGITDIIRGEDHLTSTPRQILLIEALGGNIPQYTHLPLIIGKDKKKLSKRHGAINYSDFEKLGYLPEAIINYLALLGWNPGKGSEQEFFTIEELIKSFSLEGINNSPAMFSYEKLDDLNRQHLLKLNFTDYKKNVSKFLKKPVNDKIINLVIKERIKKFSDVSEMEKNGEFDYFLETPKIKKEERNFKDITTTETEKILLEIIEKMKDISEENWQAEKIKEVLWDWSGEIGRGKVLHPMRFSLSGVNRSPDPFILAEILGKKETLKRLK